MHFTVRFYKENGELLYSIPHTDIGNARFYVYGGHQSGKLIIATCEEYPEIVYDSRKFF